jgi:hypothetical protein
MFSDCMHKNCSQKYMFNTSNKAEVRDKFVVTTLSQFHGCVFVPMARAVTSLCIVRTDVRPHFIL